MRWLRLTGWRLTFWHRYKTWQQCDAEYSRALPDSFKYMASVAAWMVSISFHSTASLFFLFFIFLWKNQNLILNYHRYKYINIWEICAFTSLWHKETWTWQLQEAHNQHLVPPVASCLMHIKHIKQISKIFPNYSWRMTLEPGDGLLSIKTGNSPLKSQQLVQIL